MTSSHLAAGYYRKCSDRLAALDVLLAREAWSDLVSESQEIVELALKGVLRSIGVDPPKWHDGGGLVVEYAEKLPAVPVGELQYLAAASKSLRKEREFSFHGGVDFVPTDEYDRNDGMEAAEQARRATKALGAVLEQP